MHSLNNSHVLELNGLNWLDVVLVPQAQVTMSSLTDDLRHGDAPDSCQVGYATSLLKALCQKNGAALNNNGWQRAILPLSVLETLLLGHD
jgi:hypothetical protein